MIIFKQSAAFFVSLICVAVLAVVFCFLTAPPLMIAMTRENPREWPRIYEPLVPGFWCKWTRPIFVWYFDDLWKAGTEYRGG